MAGYKTRNAYRNVDACIKAEHCASRTGFIPTVLLERERGGITRVMERHCSGPWTNNNQPSRSIRDATSTLRIPRRFVYQLEPRFQIARSPTSTRDRPTKEWCGCLSRLIIPLAWCRWRWCGADWFDIETVSSVPSSLRDEKSHALSLQDLPRKETTCVGVYEALFEIFFPYRSSPR